MRRVVVTGLGALTPIGNDVPTYWKALQDGVSGAAAITQFEVSGQRTRFACELKGFRAEDFLSAKESKKLDRCAQYALAASQQSITDAKLNATSVCLDRVGVVWGTGIGGLKSLSDSIVAFAQGGPGAKMNPFFIPRMIVDMPAGHISIKHGFRGPNYATVSACASASNAIIDAAQLIWTGQADAVVCGGSEATITDVGLGGFSAIRALSERNEDPASASRPFDQDRDGFVMGEGAGALVVEELSHAQARGAAIYAEVAGVGLSADAYHITAPHPQGAGALLAMQRALQHAGMHPSELDCINAHATSTPQGDVSEARAIAALLGDASDRVQICANKSAIGHLLGASGAVESIAAILSLYDGVIPPTLNYERSDIDAVAKLNLTTGASRFERPQSVLKNTFGFGGHNTSIVYKRWVET